MRDFIASVILPAAYTLLPPDMNTLKADAFLIAVGQQESAFASRRQHHHGPARGFWQFEAGGIRAVLTHQRSAQHAERLCTRLCYGGILPAMPELLLDAIEHNDVLAAGFARLLLWTLPSALPGPNDAELAWDQYIRGWRPGRPRPSTWVANYLLGWQTIARRLGGSITQLHAPEPPTT